MNRNVLRVWSTVKDPLQTEIRAEAERLLTQERRRRSRLLVRLFVTDSTICVPFRYRGGAAISRVGTGGGDAYARSSLQVGALLCSLSHVEASLHIDSANLRMTPGGNPTRASGVDGERRWSRGSPLSPSQSVSCHSCWVSCLPFIL
jgi:hypothetical protein